MKNKPLSELINDPNLESEDIVQYALHSKTNDNILTTNLCDLIVKYVDQQTQSLTEEIKELKAENERRLITRQSVKSAAEQIIYLPVTNGKSEQSIQFGTNLIQSLIDTCSHSLKAENERLREALKQILNTNSAYFDGQISRMKNIAHNAITQNKEER